MCVCVCAMYCPIYITNILRYVIRAFGEKGKLNSALEDQVDRENVVGELEKGEI